MNPLARLTGFWAPLAVMAFSGAYLVLAWRLPTEAQAMPVGVAWVTLGLAALDFLSRTATPVGRAVMRALNPAGDKDVEEQRSTAAPMRQALGVGLPLAFMTALVLLGIVVGTALFVFTAIWLSDRRRPLQALVLAAAATAAIWLLFAGVLKLNLFPGVLLGSLL
jgi:hypothetical protein